MIYTLDTYGLEGTLLIMGGIALNICVSGMLFRPAKFYLKRYYLKMERQRRNCTAVLRGAEETSKACEVNSEIETNVDGKTAGYTNKVCVEDICVDQDMVRNVVCQHKEDSLHTKSLYSGEVDGENCTEERERNDTMTQMCAPTGERNLEFNVDNSTQLNDNNIVKEKAGRNDVENSVGVSISVLDADFQSIPDARCTPTDHETQKPPIFECSLLTNPILLIYAATMGIGFSVYVDMFIMMTPHAVQSGFSHTKGSVLVTIMGASDIVARASIGVFADFNIVKNRTIFQACLAVCSVVLFVLPSLNTYPLLACACVLAAAAGGGYMAIFPTLLAESMGIDRMSTAYGMVMFPVGGMVMVVPVVTGR